MQVARTLGGTGALRGHEHRRISCSGHAKCDTITAELRHCVMCSTPRAAAPNAHPVLREEARGVERVEVLGEVGQLDPEGTVVAKVVLEQRLQLLGPLVGAVAPRATPLAAAPRIAQPQQPVAAHLAHRFQPVGVRAQQTRMCGQRLRRVSHRRRRCER
eukprot:2727030-Pleurochrysis_carterae.AAC.2